MKIFVRWCFPRKVKSAQERVHVHKRIQEKKEEAGKEEAQRSQGVVLSPPPPPLRAGLAVSVSEAALAVPRFSLGDE